MFTVTAWRHIHKTCTPWPRGHGLAVSDMPDARRYTRQKAKDMPSARQAREVLASAGAPWPGHRDDGASAASGGIRLSPPLGQKPWGQGLSQTERGPIIATCHA